MTSSEKFTHLATRFVQDAIRQTYPSSRIGRTHYSNLATMRGIESGLMVSDASSRRDVHLLISPERVIPYRSNPLKDVYAVIQSHYHETNRHLDSFQAGEVFAALILHQNLFLSSALASEWIRAVGILATYEHPDCVSTQSYLDQRGAEVVSSRSSSEKFAWVDIFTLLRHELDIG